MQLLHTHHQISAMELPHKHHHQITIIITTLTPQVDVIESNFSQLEARIAAAQVSVCVCGVFERGGHVRERAGVIKRWVSVRDFMV